ncbi:MAG: GNAT family N-acetyltransferase [Chthoniobacterales bacterium]
METSLILRDVLQSDLPLFYEDQADEEASRMAAFTSRNPEAFETHWKKIFADKTTKRQTVIYGGETAGYVIAFNRSGERELGYWIRKAYWGRGIASRAVAEFLRYETTRPLSALVAIHNKASMRVLEKSGFVIVREEADFAKAGDTIIAGVVMRLS